jgi:Zn-dependent protease with chaperone function
MDLILFTVFFLYLCNQYQIRMFFDAYKNPKSIQIIEDREITNYIKKKTLLVIDRITIFNSEKLFGMMPGTPFNPSLILSKGLYEKLNKGELKWVLLHEAAHCIKWHVVQAGIIQIVGLCIGISLLLSTPPSDFQLIFSLSLSFIIGLICIRIIRHSTELEADKYAIAKIDDPKDVISAQEKFRKYNGEKAYRSLRWRLWGWNISLEERIELAKQRI